nr:immunoglobulin heavy chain junction region [Mus musculus]
CARGWLLPFAYW